MAMEYEVRSTVSIADQYGLVLMRDLTYLGKDGDTYHEHYQFTSIQLDATPPVLREVSRFCLDCVRWQR